MEPKAILLYEINGPSNECYFTNNRYLSSSQQRLWKKKSYKLIALDETSDSLSWSSPADGRFSTESFNLAFAK